MKTISSLFIVILAVAALAGCTSVGVRTSNPRSVIMQGNNFEMDKMEVEAEKECNKYNRHAVFNKILNGDLASYNCVD